jgi:Transposase IS116/IS110/IS902 family
MALARVKAATPHDVTPRSLWPTVPGLGTLRRLVRLSAIPEMDRCPIVQAVVSYCRVVKCAQAAAGQRGGTSGNTLGTAPRPWALSEAAALCLRHNPAGPTGVARVENKHGKGKALTMLAHPLARAVYDMLKRQTACAVAKFLQSEGSSTGEPDASLDT